MQLPADFQTVETRCGREGHTRPRGHSENPRCSCQQTPRGLETRCGREGHTRPRGPSESPDGVDPNIRRTIKTQRDGHNNVVKIWSLCSVSSILSHANLSNPCNKVRGKCNSKEVFLCLPSCVILLASLSLCHGTWLYNISNVSYITSISNSSLSLCVTSLIYLGLNWFKYLLNSNLLSLGMYITLPSLLMIIPSSQKFFPTLWFLKKTPDVSWLVKFCHKVFFYNFFLLN